MVVEFKVHNDVRISSVINMDTYKYFIKHLSEALTSLDQEDYSDVFTLDNETYYGQSVLKGPTDWTYGTVKGAIHWLRLVDLFILRPHGCYLTNHLNFSECDTCWVDLIVVSFITKDESLVTRITRFSENVEDSFIREEVTPKDMWLQLVSQLLGHEFNRFEYISNADDCGINLKFYGPEMLEGFDIKDNAMDSYYVTDFDILVRNFL